MGSRDVWYFTEEYLRYRFFFVVVIVDVYIEMKFMLVWVFNFLRMRGGFLVWGRNGYFVCELWRFGRCLLL